MSPWKHSPQPPRTAEAATEGDAADVPPELTSGDAPAGDTPPDGPLAADGGWRERHPGRARVLAVTTTVLAAALVLAALLLPNELTRLTPGAFARVPLEGIAGAAVLLVLPPMPRRIVAVLAGAGLGVVTVLSFLDMGFYSTLDRPFDPVLDWGLFDDAESFLGDSVGRAGALAAVVGVVVLVLAVLVLMTLSVVRLSGVLVRHSAAASGTTLVLGTAWITLASLGVQDAGVPVASMSTVDLVQSRTRQVRADLKDEQAFRAETTVDAFGDTPPDQLLTGLRGKDVIFAFVESYGRSAIEDPEIAPGVDAMLADSTDKLRAAGFSARSGFLTSPTAGGGSWLAHSTFLSGLWIKNQQRYRSVTSGDRLTLTGAFRRADAWRTVGIMPGVTRSWPEGKFYGLEHVYDSRQLGYEGPKFSWAPVPDQYSLSAFERLEHGRPGAKPLMSEVILVSSHNPWAPLPKMIDWDQVGDGSVYESISEEGKDPKEVWKDPHQVRAEYGHAIQYSVSSLVSFMQKHGNDNTVLVFLGDHQPVPTVTGEHASRDVPISIVAHDPAVLARISGWGWDDGLNPAPDAPVWRMDTFRDRFLTAYGPTPRSTPEPGAAPSPSPSTAAVR